MEINSANKKPVTAIVMEAHGTDGEKEPQARDMFDEAKEKATRTAFHYHLPEPPKAVKDAFYTSG